MSRKKQEPPRYGWEVEYRWLSGGETWGIMFVWTEEDDESKAREAAEISLGKTNDRIPFEIKTIKRSS